ncbi:MAG TPA: alpha/beta fold hydrolase [Candidatus Humimicrobiaceae bacterium]
MEKEVVFYSNRVKLQGRVCIPNACAGIGNAGFPVAVLAHGYGASKDEFGDFKLLSGILNEIGVAALAFDFRGCGDTGYPLGRMLCSSEWVEDLTNAVSFMCSFSGIDKGRVCLIGESMGASVAILSAALDMRVKCTIALSPIANGYEWVRQNWIENKGIKEFELFLEELSEDKKREAIYGQSNLLKMPDALAYKKRYLDLIEEIRKVFDDRNFTYYIQYSSVSSIMQMKPIEAVNAISPRPLLLLAGKKDGIVPWGKNSLKLYENAGEVKKIVAFDNGDHGLLAEPTRPGAIKEITGWLDRYLIKA